MLPDRHADLYHEVRWSVKLTAPLCVIPEGVGPVNSGFLFVIFLLAALRLLLGAPG
jgi:hypothetical protein